MNEKITAQDLWDVYRDAVGGTAYNGEPLPVDIAEAAESAQGGWLAVAEFVNESKAAGCGREGCKAA